jgi:hypothetical protein
VLRRIFGPKRKWQEAGEVCIMRSFIPHVPHQLLLGRMRWAHGTVEKHIQNFCHNTTLDNLGMDGKIILKLILKK